MKILIINGHPDKKSFNHALAKSYKLEAEKSNANVKTINLNDLKFNPILEYGYRKRTELEPDLINSIKLIKDADHIVWVFPMWWYGYPAIMKGFIERTFLPGITYELIPNKTFPKKLLKGKTSRLIITADTPFWYNYLYLKNPVVNQLKKGTLQFCGIKKVKISYISPIKTSSEKDREKWIKKIGELGQNLK